MTETTAPRAGKAAPVLGRRSAAVNLVAQGASLGAVSVASLIVARTGGAAVLGDYALLRVLPWLTGLVLSCGLPAASTYFLGAQGRGATLRPTLAALALTGAIAGTAVWLGLVAALHRLFFLDVPEGLLILVGATVITQLWTVWAKACCQGSADMWGANLIIVCEELMFLPAYGLALAFGLRGIEAIIAGMVAGGVCATAIGVGRMAVQGYFRGWGAPSPRLAKSVLGFGARGQLGNLLWLVNLRLDFLLLGVLAGPATLGVYAVASKFAELMRLPATALNYVLYPRFTRALPAVASRDARHLLGRACLVSMAATPLLAGLSIVALPLLFGQEFQPAVVPACLLLVGLAVEGAAAVASAYLWGAGRPGANSVGMGVGVVITIALDLLLIPRYGASGAAIASSAAYLATAGVLSRLAWVWSQRSIDMTHDAIPTGDPL